eukprot:gene2416-2649_t
MKSTTLFDRHHARLTGKSSAQNSSSSSSGEVGLSRGANKILEAQRTSTLYQPNALRCDPLKRPKEEREATLGKGWFDLKPMKMDEKLQQDIDLIRMRNFLDPKRFYKNPDKIGNVVHVGTVVEGPTEYKTARLSNRERKQTIVQEVLADSQLRSYNKRTFLNIQETKSKKRKFFKAKKHTKH